MDYDGDFDFDDEPTFPEGFEEDKDDDFEEDESMEDEDFDFPEWIPEDEQIHGVTLNGGPVFYTDFEEYDPSSDIEEEDDD